MRFGRRLLPAARTRRNASAASAGCLRARQWRRALCKGAPLRRGRSRVMKTMKGKYDGERRTELRPRGAERNKHRKQINSTRNTSALSKRMSP